MINHPKYEWLSVDIENDRILIDGFDRTNSLHTRFRNKTIHLLVAEICMEKPVDCNTVGFKDGDKTNIKPSNLFWTKRDGSKNLKRGLGWKRKLSDDQVLEIVDMLNNLVPRDEISKKFDICKGTIYKILVGESYQDVTGVNPNREILKGPDYFNLPNGKYVFYRGGVQTFDTAAEAKAASKKYWREYFADLRSKRV